MPTVLNYFVCYARADQRPVERLLSLLRPRLQIAADFEFSEWKDKLIPVGQGWRGTIKQALQCSDFGLLLLSPNFFASSFIKTDEAPHFLETVAGGALNVKKPVVPVGLKPVPLDGSANLGRLEQLQIFRNREGRWFSETRGHISDAYADQLVAAMLAKLTAAAL